MDGVRRARALRACVGVIVCAVLPIASMARGSSIFAWTMYSRAGRFRIDLVATDAAGARRVRNPTILAEHASAAAADLVAGSDGWRDGSAGLLRAHLDELAEHACSETHAAEVELTLHERTGESPERLTRANRACSP